MKNSKSGITLIALVVTIIVLLILAGVSIQMLTGDNGILNKAAESKVRMNREEIIENARIDVLADFTGNSGNNISETQLKNVLKKYFINSEIPEELPNDLSTVELTTLDNQHKIKISEIYNGTLLKDTTSGKLTELVKNVDYGKSINYSVTVSGTTLNNWQVFLNDGNNVYIILANNLPSTLMPDLGYPVENNGGWYGLMYESDGSPEDITDKLMDTNRFQFLVNASEAISATGAPSLSKLTASYGTEINKNSVLSGVMYSTR